MFVTSGVEEKSRKEHRGIPGFKKNLISFPQDIADLKNHQHFFSSLGENDIVNVRLRSNDVEADNSNERYGEDTLSPLRRARVLQLLPEGVQVQLDDEEGTDPEKAHCRFARHRATCAGSVEASRPC